MWEILTLWAAMYQVEAALEKIGSGPNFAYSKVSVKVCSSKLRTRFAWRPVCTQKSEAFLFFPSLHNLPHSKVHKRLSDYFHYLTCILFTMKFYRFTKKRRFWAILAIFEHLSIFVKFLPFVYVFLCISSIYSVNFCSKSIILADFCEFVYFC